MIENELVSMNWNTRIRDSCRIEEINAYSCRARSCEIYFFDINFTAQTSPVNMWIHWRTMEWRPLWTEKMVKNSIWKRNEYLPSNFIHFTIVTWTISCRPTNLFKFMTIIRFYKRTSSNRDFHFPSYLSVAHEFVEKPSHESLLLYIHRCLDLVQ